jgi:hypothetical protein
MPSRINANKKKSILKNRSNHRKSKAKEILKENNHLAYRRTKIKIAIVIGHLFRSHEKEES